MKKLILTLFIFLMIRIAGVAQQARDATFHTEDINRFWHLIDQHAQNINGKILQEDYLDKGSEGLKSFINMRIESGKNLYKVYRKEKDYYSYMRPFTVAIEKQTEKFYQCFEVLQSIYPDAVFPDVYFVIGANNTGGAIFKHGLVIGAERFGKPLGKFQPALDFELLDEVVAHELIHFQQHYVKDNSLLAQCIREGSADFLGEIISGGHSHDKMYAYGYENRAALWKEFEKQMHTSNWNNWLYYQADKKRPKDLGYWMGYEICKAYYAKARDKQKAIVEILNIKDFKKFLEESGYKGD